MEAVRGGVENCIRQLSASAVPTNNASFKEGADYTHPARSAAEISADLSLEACDQFLIPPTDPFRDDDDLFTKLSRTITPEVKPNATTINPNNDSSMFWM